MEDFPCKVTVIVPNYNHARYLPERLDSVLGQTYPNLEVILMDDCSTDDSRRILDRYAAQDDRVRCVYNEQNGGSTFRQWNKGLALAQGKYVWLAESDDYADPEFLTTLMTKLEADPDTGLAYCNSWSVDENSEPMPVPTWQPFLAELDPKLWQQDFVADGLNLVRRFMPYRNIIPNASAVLLRRSTLQQVGPPDEGLKVFGDWVFWAKMLAAGRVAYVSHPLNYFRTHRNNVRSKTQLNGTALVETTKVLAAMHEYAPLDPFFYQKAVNLLLVNWFHAFVYYEVPWSRHLEVYTNMVALDPNFKRMFVSALSRSLFGNKLSGLRILLGDKLMRAWRKPKPSVLVAA